MRLPCRRRKTNSDIQNTKNRESGQSPQSIQRARCLGRGSVDLGCQVVDGHLDIPWLDASCDSVLGKVSLSHQTSCMQARFSHPVDEDRHILEGSFGPWAIQYGQPSNLPRVSFGRVQRVRLSLPGRAITHARALQFLGCHNSIGHGLAVCEFGDIHAAARLREGLLASNEQRNPHWPRLIRSSRTCGAITNPFGAFAPG